MCLGGITGAQDPPAACGLEGPPEADVLIEGGGESDEDHQDQPPLLAGADQENDGYDSEEELDFNHPLWDRSTLCAARAVHT